ncbi:MAG: DUF4830 domain-containing protein [Oscillospiraceae bacterium]|nr:DUF4830 domain-containing protein [Oscillospiraceae bacterium]
MFIVTAKLTKKRLVGAIVVAGAILIAVIVLIASNNRADAANVGAVKNIKTNDDRVAYLMSLGWDVSGEPVDTQEVLIPGQWDEVLENYETLQSDQGMSLEKYKNKRVTRYTYQVLNHPSGESQVYACLLVYKNRVIAGDIQSYALDGFMESLERR